MRVLQCSTSVHSRTRTPTVMLRAAARSVARVARRASSSNAAGVTLHDAGASIFLATGCWGSCSGCVIDPIELLLGFLPHQWSRES